MQIDKNLKKAELLIKKITKGAKGTYRLSPVEKNMIIYIAKLEKRIKQLEDNEKLLAKYLIPEKE